MGVLGEILIGSSWGKTGRLGAVNILMMGWDGMGDFLDNFWFF